MDTNMKLYYVVDKNNNPRHVVVATGDLDSKKAVPVARVGLHPSVEGKARRGAPPKFAKPVPLSELHEMTLEEVPEALVALARRALDNTAAVSNDTESEQPPTVATAANYTEAGNEQTDLQDLN